MEQDVNKYWDFVKSKYPDARFVRWFEDGELHFYPDGKSERDQKNLGSCFRDSRAHMQAEVGDGWA